MKYISRKDYILHLLKNINYYKTARINFHYFPFKIAIKFPIILFGKVDIDDCLRSHINKKAVNQKQRKGIFLTKFKQEFLDLA